MESQSTDREELFSEGALTIAALKKEFSIGRSTAYAMMDDGRLPFSTAFGRRLIPRLAVKRLLAANLNTGK